MSILETTTIDLVASRPGSSLVKLLIADHLDWTDFEAHASLLQAKINTYLDFVDSGQMNRLPDHAMPASPQICITLAVPQPPPPVAEAFLNQVELFLKARGIEFETELRGANR